MRMSLVVVAWLNVDAVMEAAQLHQLQHLRSLSQSPRKLWHYYVGFVKT